MNNSDQNQNTNGIRNPPSREQANVNPRPNYPKPPPPPMPPQGKS